MNHIKVLDSLSSQLIVQETISSHDKYPAIFSGEMSIQDTDCEEFIKEKVEIIFKKSRERWSGLQNMSFCYGIDSKNRKLKYSVAISSENLTFSFYVLDFIKRFMPKLDVAEDVKLQSDDDTDEDVKSSTESIEESDYRIPSELVQIQADSSTVKNWIDSFVKSRREVINTQNIKEFCLPPEQRQNCARVDAVLVKRKDTSSHIRVEHVSNLWGPEIRHEFSPQKNKPSVEEHNYSVTKRTYQSSSEEVSKKKKIYTSQDVALKLEQFKMKYQSQGYQNSDSMQD